MDLCLNTYYEWHVYIIKCFRIDTNHGGGATTTRQSVVASIIYMMCCVMCSSCMVHCDMCVPSSCEVWTNSVGCPRDGAPPAIHAAAAAQALLSPRSPLRQWHSQAWRPAVGLLGVPVPVSSLHFSRRSVAFVLRHVSCSPRSGSSVCLFRGLRRRRWVFTPVRRRSTCSGGTGRDRSGARGPSSAPPGMRGCSSGPC